MKLLPQDLPLDWFVRFAQARDNPAKAGAEAAPPRLGVLGPIMASGAGLDRERAAHILPALRTNIVAWMVPFSIWSGMMLLPFLGFALDGKRDAAEWICLLLGTGFFGTGLLGVRAWIARVLARPLSPQEVDRLLAVTTDPQERLFLELVRDAVRQPLPREAEEMVREAITGVAEAIARLPAIQRSPLDTAALLEEATDLERQAGEQADQVVADSYRRRAEAIRHRVAAHERSSILFNRSEALRQEIAAQIAALREGLAAYDAPSADPGALHSLALAAKQVAAEATSVASARSELEAECMIPATPLDQPAVQRVGTG